MGLGAFGTSLPYLRDPAKRPVVERVIGNSLDAFLGGQAKLQSYLIDLGDEALSLTRS